MSQMVRRIEPRKVHVVNPFKSTRNKKTMNVETETENKFYRVVYTKRVPVDNYDTEPNSY